MTNEISQVNLNKQGNITRERLLVLGLGTEQSAPDIVTLLWLQSADPHINRRFLELLCM